MIPTTHIVKAGDTLWDLSQQYLQDPKRWPEIWDYNNDAFVRLPAANKMRPSVAIKNPHLIFVGQKLLVPTNMMKKIKQAPLSPAKGKSKAVNNVKSIPIKYSIDSKEYIQALPGGLVAKVKISAELTLQSLKAIPFIELQNNELNIKASIKRENELGVNKLFSDFTIGLNPKTKQISFESQMTVNSGESYQQTWSTKVTLDPITGQPIYTVSIKFPEIKGRLGNQAYLASQYQIDIEISKDETRGRQGNVMPATVPVSVAAENSSNDWVYAIATALVVGAVVVVVATIAEDIITLGVGIADDAVSFAFAAGLLGRAWTMVRMQQVGVQLGAGAAIGSTTASVAF
jgi:LysM repeat protein